MSNIEIPNRVLYFNLRLKKTKYTKQKTKNTNKKFNYRGGGFEARNAHARVLIRVVLAQVTVTKDITRGKSSVTNDIPKA